MGENIKTRSPYDPASPGAGEAQNQTSSSAPGTAGGVGGNEPMAKLPRLRELPGAERGPATICWGRKVRGSNRLECGEPIDDPRVVDEVMRLINEFLDRVEKHKAVLLSESATPFDNAINALSNWLQEIKVKVGEGGSEGIIRLRNAMLDIGRAMLRLAEEAREGWLKKYRRELEELVERLRSGGVKIIISGDPFDKDVSFTVHLYMDGLAIVVDRVAKRGNITMWVSFTGLEGVRVVVPRLLGDGKLRAMQCGLLLTDGSIHVRGYPMMDTAQLWQVIAWLIAWPGRNHMYIHGLNLNDSGVSVMWRLMAVDHKGAFKNKAEVAEEASKLGDEEFPTFMLYAILGDGNVNVKEKSVRLTMGKSKLELWGGIIERLKSLGFRKKNDNGYAVAYAVNSSKAIELARKMLSDEAVKALIENLAQLPDAERLRRLITLAGMEPGHWAVHQSR